MTNGFKGPEDYPGGVEEFANDKSNEYGPLMPLGQRSNTEIRVNAPKGGDEAEMYAKLGFSRPIALLIEGTQTLYGFFTNANLKDDLELTAMNGINSLNDLIMDAECLNRKGRYEVEERLRREYESELGPGDKEKVDDLLHEWNEADAFMLQCRIIEERDGLDAGVPYYPKFKEMKKRRDEAEMKSPELPPAAYQLFRCRVRMLKIRNERAFDLALDYPTADVTDLKKELEAGGNIHKLHHAMMWPFKVGYQLYTRSVASGDTFRELIMSMYAQQMPNQQRGYWGGPPGWGMGPMNGYQGDGEDGDEPDKRRAFFSFGGGPKPPKEPENKARRNRRRGKR